MPTDLLVYYFIAKVKILMKMLLRKMNLIAYLS